MKRIRWLDHAKKKAASREIPEAEVEKTVSVPEAVTAGRPPRRILMRRYFDPVLQTEMLLRVVVEETAEEWIIVTLYKTSKFQKYQAGEPS
jgi:hypothetical protein